jgi:hypothetical protein
MVNKSPLPNPTKADAEYISCIPPCNKIFQKFYNSLAACRQSLNGRSNGFSFNPMHTNGEVIRKAIIAHPMDHSHLAAEQRAAVAHGASLGFGRHIFQKPRIGPQKIDLFGFNAFSSRHQVCSRFVQSPAK